MRSSIKIITIQGIQVYFHWTLLLLAGWVVVTSILNALNMVQIGWALFFMAAVLASIILHELAHAFVAALFGISAGNVILLPIGGIASIERLPEAPKQELAISAAGPLMSILIAMMLSVFVTSYKPFYNIREYTGIISSGNFLYSLYMVNIALAIFNLVPAFPMDGGRILRALLAFKFNYIRATEIAASVGKIIGWVFIIVGAVTFNPFLLLIGLFAVLLSGTEENYLRLRALVQGVKVKDALMYDYNQLQATQPVSEVVNILENNHSKFFIVMMGAQPVGTINRMEVIKAIADMKYNEPISSLMKEDLEYFEGATEIENVLDQLARQEDRIFPVMDEGRFLGVISFSHVIEYLLIHKVHTKDYGKMKSLASLLQ